MTYGDITVWYVHYLMPWLFQLCTKIEVDFNELTLYSVGYISEEQYEEFNMSDQMPSYAPPVRPPDPLSPESERLWAALAHLSAVLSLFSGGIFGSLISIIIWGVFKRRSKYVAFQALQAFVFQLVTFGFGVCFLLSPFLFLDNEGWFIIIGLSSACAIIWMFALCAYALIAAVQCYNGADFRYLIIGNVIPK